MSLGSKPKPQIHHVSGDDQGTHDGVGARRRGWQKSRWATAGKKRHRPSRPPARSVSIFLTRYPRLPRPPGNMRQRPQRNLTLRGGLYPLESCALQHISDRPRHAHCQQRNHRRDQHGPLPQKHRPPPNARSNHQHGHNEQKGQHRKILPEFPICAKPLYIF